MRYLVIACALASCGKSKPAADDWSRIPFKTIDSSTGGVAFSISIPENWEPRAPADGGWGPPTGDAFQRPSVTVQNVSLDMATSMESAIAAAGAKPELVVRKEARPDGYHLTEVHDETLARATVFKKVAPRDAYIRAFITPCYSAGVINTCRSRRSFPALVDFTMKWWRSPVDADFT